MTVQRIICIAALGTLAACGSDRELQEFGSVEARPAELAVRPGQPLVMPERFDVLPEPTPAAPASQTPSEG